MRNRLLQLTLQLTSQSRSAWIAMCVVLAMLGQSLLPTLAYVRSNSNPGLWDEICSVYGVRVVEKTVGAPDSDQVPGHHADCPLCLHVFNDIVLDTPTASISLQLLFLNEIRYVFALHHFTDQRSIIPEARGPPAAN